MIRLITFVILLNDMSSRPKGSMFLQIVKSIITGDGSLRRMTNHQGGKQFSIIFAYIAYSAYREMMLKENIHGKVGKDIFKESEWLSPRQFLEKMGYEPSKYTVNMATDMLNSFTQEGAFERKDEAETFEYKFKKDVDKPSDDDIAKARESNRLFMMSIDDLIVYTQKTFENGYPVVSRDASEMQPLWESLHNDELITAFRVEHIRNIDNNLPKLNDTLDYLEIGVFTGLGTIETIDKMVKKYDNITINYTLIEEIKPLMIRAKQKIEYHLSTLNHITAEKKITFNMNFINVELENALTQFKDNSFDIVAAFQVLHYMSDKHIEPFIRNVHQVLKSTGVFCLGQSTSYALEFPYPFTLIYNTTDNFKGYPLKDELKIILEPYFDKVKSTGLDAIWTMKRPVKK